MSLIAQVPLVAAYVYRRSDYCMATSFHFSILFCPSFVLHLEGDDFLICFLSA